MASNYTDLDDKVGYNLGITPSATTTPNITEIKQWIQDAERQMISRLPLRHVYTMHVPNEQISLVTPFNYGSFSNTAIKLLGGSFYNGSYKDCKVVDIVEFWNTANLYNGKELPLSEINIALDQSTNRIYIHPVGVSGNKVYVSYLRDINTGATTYQLAPITEPAAVLYASGIASLQVGDPLNMAEKYLANYEKLIETLSK